MGRGMHGGRAACVGGRGVRGKSTISTTVNSADAGTRVEARRMACAPVGYGTGTRRLEKSFLQSHDFSFESADLLALSILAVLGGWLALEWEMRRK